MMVSSNRTHVFGCSSKTGMFTLPHNKSNLPVFNTVDIIITPFFPVISCPVFRVFSFQYFTSQSFDVHQYSASALHCELLNSFSKFHCSIFHTINFSSQTFFSKSQGPNIPIRNFLETLMYITIQHHGIF